ncbi:MAG: hypothetical protein IH892_03230 [Planctomycetes bacterium]|nr:hypothetical protein [Planctomycetota bacterium]
MKRSSVLAMETAADLTTPAFVFDLDLLDDSAGRARQVTQGAGCRLLYSVKACAHRAVMRRILPVVEGFSCSSPFEARWTREIVRSTQSIHCTAPGLRPADIDELVTTCDYLSFNSLGQHRLAEHHEAPQAQYGLRVNPEYSLVSDDRYDPCCKHSKLGILPDELEASFSPGRKLPDRVTGLHIHSNCDSSDFGQLRETVRRLDRRLGHVLDQVAWINLGGGYLFDDPEAIDRLRECMEILGKGRQVEVFIEPGAGIVNDCGHMVSTVVDLLVRDGRSIAILDTTVNHLPEVFEFELMTEVIDAIQGEGHEYLLAGSSCLAGDLFGGYTFAKPLRIGQRILFAQVGAYSLVKAHMFNGICLPRVYTYCAESGLTLECQTDYDDYVRQLWDRQ